MAKTHSSLTGADLHNPKGMSVENTTQLFAVTQSVNKVNLSGSFLPTDEASFDLGSAALSWKDIYVSSGSIKFIDPSDNSVLQTLTADSSGISFGGGNVSGSTISGSKLHIVGNAFIGGNLTLGDADTDTISITADFTSNLIPNADITYDLGSTSKQWRDVYTGRALVGQTGSLHISSSLTVLMDGRAGMLLPSASSDPTVSGTSEKGMTYFNLTDNLMKVYSGTDWVPVGSTETKDNVLSIAADSDANNASSAIKMRVDGTSDAQNKLVLNSSNIHEITGSLNISSSITTKGTEVDTSGSTRDQVLKFNGTKYVPAAYNYTFVFSIASFSDGESTSQIAGTAAATWKAADAITFTATYNNGPPTTAAISESTAGIGVSDWTTPFATDDNTVAITYPNPGSTRRFRLIADGESDYESSITFKNYIYYGASTQADSYNESFIESLTSTLSEDKTQNNKSINASGNKYIFWTYPNRLGTVSNYFIWGTTTSNQVVIATSVIGSAYSVTNSAGLTENYKIYRSDVTVDESGRLDTGVSLINYIYWGSTGHDSIPGASGWDSDDIKNLEFKTDSNDGTQVWTEITSMTSDYILLCIPSRITDPASFWDNSTGFGADFESSVTVSVINQYGYTENYDVFRSTNTVTGDFTLETK